MVEMLRDGSLMKTALLHVVQRARHLAEQICIALVIVVLIKTHPNPKASIILANFVEIVLFSLC
jgi:hypothetical protein